MLYCIYKVRKTPHKREDESMRRVEFSYQNEVKTFMAEHEVVEATIYTDADSGKIVLEYFLKD